VERKGVCRAFTLKSYSVLLRGGGRRGDRMAADLLRHDRGREKRSLSPSKERKEEDELFRCC